jgi:ABC-type glycerol-3-phosphate transport system substrate-binding protein
MAKKHLAAVLFAFVALASACGGSGSKAVVPSSTTSTTLAIDFAKQYLDVEASFRERAAAANAALQVALGGGNVPNIIEALHVAGSVNWEFATALLAQKWPDDLRPSIQKQAKLLGDFSEWQRIATESDWTSMLVPMQHLGVEVSDATQATRELLGLPPSESPGDVLNA